jgi:hypothetical protein
MPSTPGRAHPRCMFLRYYVELGTLGKDRTQLAISGRYDPPLGTVGRTIDHIALHRVAEATIKDFLDRVAAVLEAAAPSPNGHAPTPRR